MKLINRNSYLIMSAMIWVAVAFVLSDRLSLLWTAVVLLVLAVVFYTIHQRTKRSVPAGEAATPATAAEAAGGKFALIDFYSDY